MKVKYALFALLVSVLMMSCKGRKNKQDSNNSPVNQEVTVKPFKVDETLLKQSKDFFAYRDDYNTIEEHFQLKLQSPDLNHTVSGTLRCKPDSLLWIQIKAMGIEIARAKFTTDSVFIVVKLKNQYFKGNYSSVRNMIPVAVDFNSVQSIFLNRMFIFPENNVENLPLFSMTMLDSKTLELNSLPNPDYNKKFSYDNVINIDTEIKRMVQSKLIFPVQGKEATVTYSDYQDFSGYLLPKEMKIVMDSYNLGFSINKVNIDKSLTYPLTIPDSYKPF